MISDSMTPSLVSPAEGKVGRLYPMIRSLLLSSRAKICTQLPFVSWVGIRGRLLPLRLYYPIHDFLPTQAPT